MIRRSISAYCVLAVTIALLTTALPARQALAVSLQEEIDIGRKLNEEILKQTPVSTDRTAQKEMDEYGQALVKGVKRPQIEYHFTILHQDDLNAFSIPGGYVYFADRLWSVLRRDERIGVLAHEIIHVDRRHAINQMLDAQRRQIWLSVLLSAVKANDIWSNVADLAHNLYGLKYSREDERQADEGGIDLSHKANYNPAGLLVAMRKIGRFQGDRGGEPPKILSDHPPTPERLKYLTADLTKMGVAIPPDAVKDVPYPGMIGTVTAVSANEVQFTSTKPLQRGTVIWLMGGGWDYYYESKTQVPIARGIVKRDGSTYAADIWAMRTAKKNEIARGIGVYTPTAPKPETGVGRILGITYKNGDIGKLSTRSDLKKLDRLMARQLVWSKDYTGLRYDNAGYVVLTGAPGENKFIAANRPEYLYAPVAADSILVRFTDSNAARWIGPVVSIGRDGQTIEIITTHSLDDLAKARTTGRRFDVACPAWDPDDLGYNSRVVGQATVQTLDRKLVLQMVSFSPGHTMDDIQNGFDVYEEAGGGKPKAEK